MSWERHTAGHFLIFQNMEEKLALGNHPVLYDQSLFTYRDINRRSQAWREVAETVVCFRLFWGVYIQFISGFFASYVAGGRFM